MFVQFVVCVWRKSSRFYEYKLDLYLMNRFYFLSVRALSAISAKEKGWFFRLDKDENNISITTMRYSATLCPRLWFIYLFILMTQIQSYGAVR